MLETAEREKVGMMTMVGDAYAAPLVEELRSGSYDLSSMYAIGTGGAATNPKHQQALLELLPQITLINGYGSSETGNVGFGRSQRGDQKDTFVLREGALVLSENYGRFLQPGEQEVGFVARGGSRYRAALLVMDQCSVKRAIRAQPTLTARLAETTPAAARG